MCNPCNLYFVSKDLCLFGVNFQFLVLFHFFLGGGQTMEDSTIFQASMNICLGGELSSVEERRSAKLELKVPSVGCPLPPLFHKNVSSFRCK